MFSKIFLGNLNWEVTNDCLTQFLRDEGYEFRSIRVILNQETGRSRGFAFVEFDTPEAAAVAMVGLDGAELKGRPLRAFKAVDKPRGDRGWNSSHGGDDRRRDSEDHYRDRSSADSWRSERRIMVRRRDND